MDIMKWRILPLWKKYKGLKRYTEYNEQEIIDIFNKAKDNNERDYIIDRLYLRAPEGEHNTRNSAEYSWFNSRQMAEKETATVSYNDSMEVTCDRVASQKAS